jgi:hypothetical protein
MVYSTMSPPPSFRINRFHICTPPPATRGLSVSDPGRAPLRTFYFATMAFPTSVEVLLMPVLMLPPSAV